MRILKPAIACALFLASVAVPAAADQFVFRYGPGTGAGVAFGPPVDPTDPWGPGADQNVDAHYIGFVGVPFDATLPQVSGADVALWDIDEGFVPDGIQFDGETATFSGTPEERVVNRRLRIGGYSPSGERDSDAGVSFTVLEPGQGAVSAEFYARTGRYMFKELPNPGPLPVTSWETAIPLPDGIEVTQTGHLAGTPEEEGHFAFAVSGLDRLGEEIRFVSGHIVVEDGPRVSHVADVAVHADEFVSVRPQVERAIGTLRWQVMGGPLPSGLSFSENTGRISGRIPTFDTSASFRFRAIDSDGTSGESNEFTISTGGPYVDLAEAGDRFMTAGQYGGFGFTASGFEGVQTWQLLQGELPGGVSLDSETGYVSGVPFEERLYDGVVIGVSTPEGAEATTDPFSITVGAEEIVLAVGAEGLPEGFDGTWRVRVDTSFETSPLAVTGASTGVTFSVAPGSPISSGLMLDPATGAVSGSLAEPGNHSVPLVGSDAEGRASKPFTVGIQAYNHLSLTVEESHAVARMQEFGPVQAVPAPSSVMTTEGFPFPVFSAVGAFPPGVTVDSDTGRIGGTPLQEGTYGPLMVRIEDASGEDAISNPFTIEVGERLPLEAAPAAGDIPRLMYFEKRAATAANAIGDPSWSLVSGDLPVGIHLRADGYFAGSTEETGTFGPVVLRAEDAEAAVAETEPFEVEIVLPDLKLVPRNLTWAALRPFETRPPAWADAVGEASFSASGLPDGAGVDPLSGVISGTVAEPGSWDIDLTVSDEAARSVTETLKLVIKPPLSIDAEASYALNRNSPGEIRPTHADAIGQVTWTLSGTLPPGMEFSAAAGRVHGTPEEEGTWDGLAFTASDEAGTVATREFSISVGERLPYSLSYSRDVYSVTRTSMSPRRPVQPDHSVGAVTYAFEGDLAPGLQFNPANGYFTGRPTQYGIFVGTVTGMDAEGARDEAEVTFRVTYSQGISVSSRVDRNMRQGAWSESGPVEPRRVLYPLTFALQPGASMPPGLVLDPASGSVSGIIEAESVSIPLTITDALDRTANFNLRLLPVGELEAHAPDAGSLAFSQHFPGTASVAAVNAIGTPSFALQGTLPPGLSFGPGGVISGTPSQQGTWGPLSVNVTDSTGETATAGPFWAEVGPRLQFEASTPEEIFAIADRTFSLTPVTENAVGDVQWEIAQGTLPPGVSFNASTGRISGRPAELGEWPGIVLRATDAIGGPLGTATTPPMAINVVTDGQPIGMNAPGLTAKAGYPFQTQAPSVTNAVGDLSFHSFDVGVHGLELDPAIGVISGQLDQPDVVTVNVYVTDSSNRITSRAVVIDVIDSLQVALPAIVDLTVNQAANAIVPSAINAIGGVDWDLEGALPAGLTFRQSDGRIRGTPTQMGAFPGLRVIARDTLGDEGAAQFAIVVHDSGILPTVNWNQPGDLRAGNSFTLNPSVTGAKHGDAYSINRALPAGLTLDTETGRISGSPTAQAPGIYEDLVLTLTDVNGITVSTAPITLRVAHQNYFSFQDVTHSSRRGVPFQVPAPQMSGGHVGGLAFEKQGSWPAGLSLDAQTGAISGTLQSGGSWTVAAADGMDVSRSFSFTYQPTDLQVSMPSVWGVPGQQVESLPPQVANAIGTVSFSIAGAGLPAGMQIDPSTGVISGTMPSSSFGGLRIEAADSHGTAISPVFALSPADIDPDQFSFTNRISVEPGAMTVSAPVRIFGINAPAPASVDGPAEFRTCIGNGTECGDWAMSGSVEWGQYVQMRMQAAPALSTSVAATLAIGSVSGQWTVTTRGGNTVPDAFAFTDRLSVEPGRLLESSFARIYNITDPASVSVSPGAEFRVCLEEGAGCGNWGTSGHVAMFQYVQMRMPSPSGFSESTAATLDVGGTQAEWTLATRPTQAMPNPFSFNARASLEPAAVAVSDPVHITGITDPVDASASGADVRVCDGVNSGCGGWSNGTVEVTAGQYVQVRMSAPAGFMQQAATDVSVGLGVAQWTVATRAEASIDSIEFVDVLNAEPNEHYFTDWVRLTGLADPASLSFSRTSSIVDRNAYRICRAADPAECEGVAFRQGSDTVYDSDWVQMRTLAPSYGSTSYGQLTIDGTVARWEVHSRQENAVPDPFGFVDVYDAEPNEHYFTDWVRITGLVDPASLSFSRSSSIVDRNAYRICRAADPAECEGVAFRQGSDTVHNFDWVQMRTLVPSYGSTSYGQLTIGGVAARWEVHSREEDDVPDPFGFVDVLNAETDEHYFTDWVRITGLADPARLSFSGTSISSDISGFRLCSGSDPAACEDSGFNRGTDTVHNFDWVQLRVRTHSSNGVTRYAQVTIGGVTARWEVETREEDSVPDPFGFVDVHNAETDEHYFTDWVRITGLADPARLSFSGTSISSDISGFRLCSGSDPAACEDSGFNRGTDTVHNFDWVQLRVRTHSSNGVTRYAQVTIGGVTARWEVETREE